MLRRTASIRRGDLALSVLVKSMASSGPGSGSEAPERDGRPTQAVSRSGKSARAIHASVGLPAPVCPVFRKNDFTTGRPVLLRRQGMASDTESELSRDTTDCSARISTNFLDVRKPVCERFGGVRTRTGDRTAS